MEKYGVQQSEDQEVEIVSGPHKGKVGMVKKANAGQLTVQTSNGEKVEVSETATKLKR